MQIDVLADGLGFTEGPVCLPDGRIAVTSISHGCVYIVDPAGGPVDRISTGGGPNGLALGPDGRLYVAQNGGVFGASGVAAPGVQVITDGVVDYLATGMDAPNDLVFGPDGRLWVTDTRGEIDYTAAGAGPPGWVWACSPENGNAELVIDDGPVFINGLGFTNDGSALLVTATLSSRLIAYDVVGVEHSMLRQQHTMHTFENGWPDGIAVGAHDEVWVALTGADRVDVIEATGRRTASIAVPAGSLPTNVCLGGPELAGLFVTAAHGESLLRIRLGE
jgi:gluconolactonase